MRILARVFGGIALLLLTLVGIGLLLPGEWSADVEATIAAPPDSVYAEISRVRSWPEWMPWPDSGTRFQGPPSGPGASFSWEDPVYGRGTFELEDAIPDRRLTYRVSVEDGAVVVEGRIDVAEVEEGTRLRWSESGTADLNPLLGFAALTLEERQARQLQGALDRLRGHLEGRSP